MVTKHGRGASASRNTLNYQGLLVASYGPHTDIEHITLLPLPQSFSAQIHVLLGKHIILMALSQLLISRPVLWRKPHQRWQQQAGRD